MGASPRREALGPVRLASARLLRWQTDERLAALARAGHEAAFEAIVIRYRRPLLRHCERIVSRQSSEDAVQRAFTSAHAMLRRSSAPVHLRSWLYRTATNAALDAWRLERRARTPGLGEAIGTSDSPDVELSRQEQANAVLAAMAALPPQQRDALAMRELAGAGTAEIAQALGLSPGAARQLLYRARGVVRGAASALTPIPLAQRIAESAGRGPSGRDIAELVAGGSAAATAIKAGAAKTIIGAAVVAGAGDVGRLDSSRAPVRLDGPASRATPLHPPPPARRRHPEGEPKASAAGAATSISGGGGDSGGGPGATPAETTAGDQANAGSQAEGAQDQSGQH